MYWRVVDVGGSTCRAAMPGATMVIGVRFAPALWFVICRSIWLGLQVLSRCRRRVLRVTSRRRSLSNGRLCRATCPCWLDFRLLSFCAGCVWQRCRCVA